MNPPSHQQVPALSRNFNHRGRGRGGAGFNPNRSNYSINGGPGSYGGSKGNSYSGQQSFHRFNQHQAVQSQVFFPNSSNSNQYRQIPSSMASAVSISNPNQASFPVAPSPNYDENSNGLLPAPIENQMQARNSWATSIPTSTSGLHSPIDQPQIDISVPNDNGMVMTSPHMQQLPPMCTTYYPFPQSYIPGGISPAPYYITPNSYYPSHNGYGLLPTSPPSFIPNSFAAYGTPAPAMCVPQQPFINQTFVCAKCQATPIEFRSVETMTEPVTVAE